MSECVVRMEMPTKDKACGMVFDFDGIWYCPIEKRICHQPDHREIPSWCPILCQLPEGHGRLVDMRDIESMMEDIQTTSDESGLYGLYYRDDFDFDGLPTIVPAAERSEA